MCCSFCTISWPSDKTEHIRWVHVESGQLIYPKLKVSSAYMSCITTHDMNIIETSYNEPKLPSHACWSPAPRTFATNTISSFATYGLFVDRNNTVYMIDNVNRRLHVWRQRAAGLTKTTFNTLSSPTTLFVTVDENIFVGTTRGSVEKWIPGATRSVVVITFRSFCYGLFIDIDNNLYCSLSDERHVVKQSLHANKSTPVIVAGAGSSQSNSDELYQPRGIFVDANFDLYVADCYKRRVKLFHSGQTKGITVLGDETTPFRILLLCPTSVFVDANKYLFTVDSGNGRIIRSNSHGFECIVGCSDVHSSTSQHSRTLTVATFDNAGNLFVADTTNKRIETFLLITDTFGT